ncbi:MAG: hypothetical protein P8M12_00920 [Flavobacteriales bacterium]|jgi:hypothetical protein|nr:hypothetical protein [Flavobacteriales bacterium]
MQKPFFKSRLFKLPNHKKFDFSPRYYDEEKERMEKKRAEFAKEINVDKNEKSVQIESRMREQFKSRSQTTNYTTNSSYWSNIRLLVIFGILMIGFYYIYIHLDEVLLALTKPKNIHR